MTQFVYVLSRCQADGACAARATLHRNKLPALLEGYGAIVVDGDRAGLARLMAQSDEDLGRWNNHNLDLVDGASGHDLRPAYGGFQLHVVRLQQVHALKADDIVIDRVSIDPAK